MVDQELLEKSEFKEEYLELAEKWKKLLYEKLENVGKMNMERSIEIMKEMNKVYGRIEIIEECITRWK